MTQPRRPLPLPLFTAIALLFTAAIANAQSGPGGMGMRGPQRHGLVSVESQYSVAETIDRLAAALTAQGLTVFTRIDHAANAKQAGIEIPPSQLLIFGNPKLGTALIKAGQSVALDLPMKALAYKDAAGQVHLVYNDPDFLARRHRLRGVGDVLRKMNTALAKFAEAAAK